MSEIEAEAAHRKFKHLFKGASGLSKAHKKRIIELLAQMVKKDPAKRLGLINVIIILEQIILEQVQQNCEPALQTHIATAHALGISVRAQLASFADLNQSINAENSTQLVKIISDELKYMTDNSEVIRAFTNRIFSSYLHGVTSSAEILDRLYKLLATQKKLFKRFSLLQTDIQDLSSQFKVDLLKSGKVDDNQLERLINYLKREVKFLPLKFKRELTLDNINLVNDKVTRFCDKLSTKYQAALVLLKDLKLQQELDKPKSYYSIASGLLGMGWQSLFGSSPLREAEGDVVVQSLKTGLPRPSGSQ